MLSTTYILYGSWVWRLACALDISTLRRGEFHYSRLISGDARDISSNQITISDHLRPDTFFKPSWLYKI